MYLAQKELLMEVQNCLLIAPLGASPQVLTEMLWSLYVQAEPAYLPRKVIVLTTSVGEALVRANLLNEDVIHPVTGKRLFGAPRWKTFCKEVLGGFEPELVCEVVRGEDGQTMSAHLMTAFSVYARPKDRLFHVLVWPSQYEQSHFYYPSGHEDVHIDRVEVRFPRLYRIIQSHPELTTRDQLARVSVSPNALATLLVIGELIARDGMAVVKEFVNAQEKPGPLLSKEVFQWRKTIVKMCAGSDHRLTQWQETEDVSRALNKIKSRHFKEHPLAKAYLDLRYEDKKSESVAGYVWAYNPPPHLQVILTSNKEWWPLSHLPVIEK